MAASRYDFYLFFGSHHISSYTCGCYNWLNSVAFWVPREIQLVADQHFMKRPLGEDPNWAALIDLSLRRRARISLLGSTSEMRDCLYVRWDYWDLWSKKDFRQEDIKWYVGQVSSCSHAWLYQCGINTGDNCTHVFFFFRKCHLQITPCILVYTRVCGKYKASNCKNARYH